VRGFGAWQLGADWGDVSESDGIEAVEAALESGVTFIDTADVYGDGRSDRLIGRVLAGLGGERPFVATKMGAACRRSTPSTRRRASARARGRAAARAARARADPPVRARALVVQALCIIFCMFAFMASATVFSSALGLNWTYSVPASAFGMCPGGR
jgi:Aldo/keto reductase family